MKDGWFDRRYVFISKEARLLVTAYLSDFTWNGIYFKEYIVNRTNFY